MRKFNFNLLLLLGLVGAVLVGGSLSFAQQTSENKNPYLENMQKKFKEAQDSAITQFQKDYPRPQAAVIPSTQPATPYKLPSVTSAPLQSPAPAAAKPAISSAQPVSPPPPNIYVSSSNNSDAQKNADNNAGNAVNPYR